MLRPAREAEYAAKCFSVACTPAAWSPCTYPVPMLPTRYGSSPMVSSVRPQRGSRVTSRTGARPWCTPTARIAAPIALAISRTSAGSNEAPHASGVGKIVAVQAAKPVRHSSCATAGMPNLLAAMTRACSAASARMPSAGVTGRVPNTRVSWPIPHLMSSSSDGPSWLKNRSCIGATPPSSPAAPIQTLPSWASFSSRVILPSRSVTRSSTGNPGSRQVSTSVWVTCSPLGCRDCRVNGTAGANGCGPGQRGRSTRGR